MIPTTQPLLVCLLLLCGLDQALLSRLGRCAGSLCAFQALLDFEGAKTSCEFSGGQMLVFKSEDENSLLTSLLGRLDGKLWVRSADRTGGEEGLQKCSAVSVTNSTVLWEPCRDQLDGFLCQFDAVCSRLQAVGGAQVTYTTYTGDFEVVDSETLPPGSVATASQPGGGPPDTKHLCNAVWTPAPWRCEVLNGGCEHSCSPTTDTCACPAGLTLHPNNISCSRHPCADCAQGCQQEADGRYVCQCNNGSRLAQDGKSCVDVDECEEQHPCTAEGQECVNIREGFECRCQDGFELEDGECVNVTICEKCEHMDCRKLSGVYQCVCRKGFRVSARDPTKCEQHCTERDCPARCVPNPELDKKDMHQCFCPEGYVTDTRNSEVICTDIDECDMHTCDHTCENLFGGYRCLCDEGYELQGEDKCVPVEEDGSGFTASYFTPANTPASVHPGPLPSYIKTGSVLGITVFMLLCAVLLYFLARNAIRRCGKFELPSFKHPDIDIFYLQQVTTETYKRLSFDKQSKYDSQRL